MKNHLLIDSAGEYRRGLLPFFSHLYVEDEARAYPLTEALCKRFSKAIQIPITHYKELFARPRQEWAAQRMSRKLILAKKRDGFLYRGSAVTPNFGHATFFYNSLMLNCLYDCEYCYLQGMYPSAHVVGFVNLEDFFHATDEALRTFREVYLCISYDTDLLGFEAIMGYAAAWIEFARARPGLTIELRTKSANFSALADITPTPNVILAWTVSPQAVIDVHEARTPGLAARLKNICAALQTGWPVRLCIDPIIAVPAWQEHYQMLLTQLAKEVPLAQIRDISVGLFRMNRTFFAQVEKQRAGKGLFAYDYTTQGRLVTYSPELREEMLGLMRRHLERQVDTRKIYYLDPH